MNELEEKAVERFGLRLVKPMVRISNGDGTEACVWRTIMHRDLGESLMSSLFEYAKEELHHAQNE